MNDKRFFSDYQAILFYCLIVAMNQHTFIMILRLKYHLKFRCLMIDKLSNQETM